MRPFKSAFVVFSVLVGAGSAYGLEFPKIMKCVDDAGNIVGGPEGNSCKNALPKCKDLFSKTEDSVKKLLSLKIYGYWKGMDVDLNQTTVDKVVGKELSQGMCSVVGHNIEYRGARDLEFDEARNRPDNVSTGGVNTYSGKFCGHRPMMRKGGGAANGKRELDVVFNKDQGNRWSSAILGAYPWEIRSAAYQFFLKVGAKPEDFTAALNDEALQPLAEAAQQTDEQMTQLMNSIPSANLAYCSDPNYKNLVERCSGTGEPLAMTDPAIQLCNVVGATMAMQTGGVQNAVVAQIMADAMKNFNAHFKDILKETGREYEDRENRSPWAVLARECRKNTHHFLGLNRRKKMAQQASCITDGDWLRVSGSWYVHDTDGSRKRNRKSRMPIAFRLDRSYPSGVRGVENQRNTFPYTRNGRKVTLANGFEGAVEWIIRRKVCGQSSVTSSSPPCSASFIQDKPEGVKW